MTKTRMPRQGAELRVNDTVQCMTGGKGRILEIMNTEDGQVARVDFYPTPIFTGLLVESIDD